MHSLTFLHIGSHQHLHHLLSFNELVNLRSATLALLSELEELPELTALVKLERLLLPLIFKIDAFPDMAPIHNMVELFVQGRVCCNGFLDNVCDLSRRACIVGPSWNITPLRCLPANRTKIATEATCNMFAAFPNSVCTGSKVPINRENQYPMEADVTACNGTMYCKCVKAGASSNSSTGMCYSLRRMAIACNGVPSPIAMRRTQIVKNVGDRCDSEVEAWLSCQAFVPLFEWRMWVGSIGISRRAPEQEREQVKMASVLQRSVKLSVAATAAAARLAAAGAAAVAASVQQQVLVRGFATKKKKTVSKKGSKKGSEDANFELMLRNIKGRYPEAEPWSEEDKQRFQEIGRRFNILSTIEHNHFQRDLQTKIDLKWEAINALPAHLQDEAMELDLSPVPEERGFATWTPPIEGFRRYTDEGAE